MKNKNIMNELTKEMLEGVSGGADGLHPAPPAPGTRVRYIAYDHCPKCLDTTVGANGTFLYEDSYSATRWWYKKDCCGATSYHLATFFEILE